MSPDDFCRYPAPELSEDDILAAMRQVEGYLDITPGDFRHVYQLAFRQAWTRLAAGIPVAEAMTRDVAAAAPESGLAEAAARMAERDVSGLPVVGADGKVLGVLSEKDILRRIGLSGPASVMNVIARCLGTTGCMLADVRTVTAGEVMTSPAVTVGLGESLAEAARIMREHKVNRLPVVDDRGTLAGIVSRGDVLRHPPLCMPEDMTGEGI